ncbi:MAG TPA: hypothetical protein VJW17_05415 [Pyrinomonadaceae bacterium]|nr:hypothetical protein [Pyrinomonadaceae bacterium]
MSKPLLGIVLGAILGAIDGLTAWFTPAVRNQLAGIVVGSTIKGIIAGVAIGFFAKKFNSLPIGILFGLAVGAFLAYLVALMQGGYYLEIILPGAIVGLIVGFATQKYGKTTATANS